MYSLSNVASVFCLFSDFLFCSAMEAQFEVWGSRSDSVGEVACSAVCLRGRTTSRPAERYCWLLGPDREFRRLLWALALDLDRTACRLEAAWRFFFFLHGGGGDPLEDLVASVSEHRRVASGLSFRQSQIGLLWVASVVVPRDGIGSRFSAGGCGLGGRRGSSLEGSLAELARRLRRLGLMAAAGHLSPHGGGAFAAELHGALRVIDALYVMCHLALHVIYPAWGWVERRGPAEASEAAEHGALLFSDILARRPGQAGRVYGGVSAPSDFPHWASSVFVRS